MSENTDTLVPVIEMIDVPKTYPGPPAVHAIRSVNLRVDTGEYVAIMGPSGAGKSTLLNLLGLLDRPSSGSYLLAGTNVAGFAERDRAALRGRRIGFIFQAFHLLPHRTALENVALAQLYNDSNRSRRRSAARTALRQVGLDHRVHSLPTTMSGGEQQRVAIARALINQPQILLCDEPTGNLDHANAVRLLSLLQDLHASGLTIVMITHSDEVASVASRVLHLTDGVLSASPPLYSTLMQS